MRSTTLTPRPFTSGACRRSHQAAATPSIVGMSPAAARTMSGSAPSSLLAHRQTDAPREHCARGASVWRWASNDDGAEPDIVLAAAGDIPTMEGVAAAWWLRRHAPEVKGRGVNVVDLMTLFTPDAHPHGLDEAVFVELFTRETDVVFAYHGYQRAIHEIVHGRPNAERFHVRGFNEEGTTTTPFDMVVQNGMSRYHLCIEALRRAPGMAGRAAPLIDRCAAMLTRHERDVREYLEDMPEVRDWKWSDA